MIINSGSANNMVFLKKYIPNLSKENNYFFLPFYSFLPSFFLFSLFLSHQNLLNVYCMPDITTIKKRSLLLGAYILFGMARKIYTTRWYVLMKKENQSSLCVIVSLETGMGSICSSQLDGQDEPHWESEICENTEMISESPRQISGGYTCLECVLKEPVYHFTTNVSPFPW